MSVTYRTNDSNAGAIPVDTKIKTTNTADGQVQHVNVDTSALPSGAATADNQTNGSQQTKLTDGTNIANITTDGAVQTQERYFAIAKGDVSGHSALLKFGRNPDIDASVEETIWEGGGIYAYDATAQSLEIVSSSSDDTDGGTGARTVTLIGQDANNAEQTAVITLNGTTAVAISGTWLRVYRCSVTTTGSGGVNAGTLTVRLAGAGATRLIIGVSNGQTLMAVYTIPAGYTGYILHYYASANAQTAAYVDVKLFTRSSAGVVNLKHQQAISSGYFDYKFGVPFRITEKTDIYLNAVSSANNTDVCGGFDMILVAN